MDRLCPLSSTAIIPISTTMAAVQSSPAPMVSPLLMQMQVPGPSRASPTASTSARPLEAETPRPPTPAKRPAISRSRSATPAEKRYKCQYEGCDKAYTKPSRLAEHELSHTGEVSSNPCRNGADDTETTCLSPMLPNLLESYTSSFAYAYASIRRRQAIRMREGRMRQEILDGCSFETSFGCT